MDQTLLIVIIAAAVAVLLAFLLPFLLLNSRNRVNMARMQGELSSRDEKIREREARITDLKADQEKRIEELKKERDEQLQKVVANVRNELRLEYEESLKAKKEELSKGNKSDTEGILNPLKESIVEMNKAMKENSDEHLKSTTELRSQLEQAVKEMGARTADIGAKADNLSEALSGRPKMQGNWGENMLDSEDFAAKLAQYEL